MVTHDFDGCSKCRQRMELLHTIAKSPVAPELQTFRCHACNDEVTKAGKNPDSSV
jgi:hypothetical protein